MFKIFYGDWDALPNPETQNDWSYDIPVLGECAFALRAFARSDLYHLPEGIVSLA